ncbi:exodeoxyribonuclease I [Psychromonas sp. RZ22]|uniref:exodeoxyribonuclease I n=1 Tax=Psychromonas algarum TaxID=2555643 RepID=UPI00106837C4|nr:exodeoxyribonuclease I [Psychromonas sp. RZ22]TEW56034.1 exodeoxyribonuclease I [Psychromonas sp. RZ22]
MNQDAPSLFWHDYETFGLNPGTDRPSQFAGIRTDLDLNVISEPYEWYCRPPNDYLPAPEACLVTGITPQHALQHGEYENQFIFNILQQFKQPNTCVVGYNNIRFDDEVTRFTLYRNFHDPYQREWQNGCSRWDIIDMVRACYALRPDGIEWVYDENDAPSFRLELLTKANNIAHQQAHDAMSDVYATIAMAKLIKTVHPKLFDYCYSLRQKNKVLRELKLGTFTPLVHISGMFSALQGCCSYILPIAQHPTNNNAVIVIDLNKDIKQLNSLTIEQIQSYLYTPTNDLPEGINRPPLKLIHINKCPIIASAKTLTPARAKELGVDAKQCRESINFFSENRALVEKLITVFNVDPKINREQQPEQKLYSGGFSTANDKNQCKAITELSAQQISGYEANFDDPNLAILWGRYKARNYPDTLSIEEQEKWAKHREAYLIEHRDNYIERLNILALEHQHSPEKIEVLQNLVHYLEFLTES